MSLIGDVQTSNAKDVVSASSRSKTLGLTALLTPWRASGQYLHTQAAKSETSGVGLLHAPAALMAPRAFERCGD